MSKLPDLILTKAGAAMLAKTPIGSEIPVTKWRIGTGKLPDGEDPRDRTQLVAPLRELPIASVENNGNQCLIKGQLVNTVMEAFTWRETGLYATDPDDGEILYAYGYEADGAEIPAGATQLREIEFGVELVFDNAANVTAVISKTLVFATLDDLEQTKADAVEEALEQITTSPVAENLTDSDAFATVTAAGIKRTPLSLLKQVFGKLFAPAPLSKNTTYYVNATTGSDSNDGLTQSRAKRTIQAVLNNLPKDLGGMTVVIYLYGGTLDAGGAYAVNEGRLYHGTIRIDGSNMDPEAKVIGDLRLGGSCDWELLNIRIQGNKADVGNCVIRVETAGRFTVNNGTNNHENHAIQIDGNEQSQDGILLLGPQTAAVIYHVDFQNCKCAVSTVPASFQQRVFASCAIGECSGQNNATGIYASHASIVFDRTTGALGSVRRVLQFGGLIVDGSGNFVKE